MGWGIVRVSSRVHVNTRQYRRCGAPISAVDELCALARVTRRCASVGGLRICPFDGRDGGSLTNRGPDVLLMSFESGYDQAIG